MSVRVIRGTDATPSATPEAVRARFVATARRIEAERWQARVEGETTIADAQKRARVIVEEAEKRADRVCESARVEGLEEGRREALALVARARAEEAAVTDNAIAIVVQAARALAERAVGHAIALDDESLASWAREGLASLRGARRIVVRGAASSIDRLRAHARSVGPDGASVVELVVDASLPEGVLFARSDLGEVRLEASMQIAAMIDLVRDAIAASMRAQSVRGARG